MQYFLKILMPLLLYCLLIGNTYARDLDYKFSGFGTLGATSAGDDELYFKRDLSQEGQDGGISLEVDSLIGFQLDTNFTSRLRGTAQVVIKERPEQHVSESIEWAFLGYQINSNWEVRAGRMAVDIYLLSEYRDVGFAYLWARPPVDFYGSMTISKFNGADLTYTNKINQGVLQFKVFTGSTQSNLNNIQGLFKVTLNEIIGTNLSYETNDWKLQATIATSSLAEIKGDTLLPFIEELQSFSNVSGVKETIDNLDSHNNRISFYSLGASYDKDKWLTQTEISYLQSDVPTIASYVNGYLSVGRKINTITAYTIIATTKSTEEPYQVNISSGVNPKLDSLAQTSQLLFNNSQMDQSSLSIGARWDILPRIALKAQWDHNWIKADETFLWAQPLHPGKDKEMDTLALSVNFIF